MSTDELLRWRPEFPILATTTYMVTHSLGAMPRRTRDRLAEFADAWATRGVRAWHERWWDMPKEVGDLLGRIIGAPPGTVLMLPNQSTAQSAVLSCFDWTTPRNTIVTERLNFPSNLYLFHAQERLGARIVTVPSDDGMTIDTDRLLAAIDETTRLVSVSHVLFKSSSVQNLAAIIDRAHAVGALVLADLYQSAGTVPVDVHALNVDFATGGSVKWLCGGPGAGYLYVRPDLRAALAPRLTGWAAHRHPFDFDDGPIEYADDVARFANGSPAVPALYSAMSGYEIVAEIGVPAIRAKSLRQTRRLIQLADAAGLRVVSPRDDHARGGTVVIDVPNVVDRLAEEHILVDYRPGAGIRVAPHFYTTDEEIDRTVSAIVAAARDAASPATISV
ncbi:MAG TPA: aminotransferase class V-fold PLP-dependent enzyme [Gemmatimonadaceae bacterium]|nr:aminotransferase class V-fold PLP-dependent enzyme [Gemmatimonadaceae bacterium]